MSAVLRHTLVVNRPDRLTPVALLVGTSVPEWAKDLVHADDLEDAAADGQAEVGGATPPADAEVEKPRRGTTKADS